MAERVIGIFRPESSLVRRLAACSITGKSRRQLANRGQPPEPVVFELLLKALGSSKCLQHVVVGVSIGCRSAICVCYRVNTTERIIDRGGRWSRAIVARRARRCA